MTCQEVHMGGNKEMIYLENTTTKHRHQKEEHREHEHELTMLLDSGSPRTIVGVENFRQIKQQYTPMIQSEFDVINLASSMSLEEAVRPTAWAR